MRPFKVITEWQGRYFGLPVAPPRRDRPSDAKEEWDDLLRQREAREQHDAVAVTTHVRHLREREQVARWRPLVERYGAGVVESIMRRQVDPAFRLPAALRPEQEL